MTTQRKPCPGRVFRYTSTGRFTKPLIFDHVRLCSSGANAGYQRHVAFKSPAGRIELPESVIREAIAFLDRRDSYRDWHSNAARDGARVQSDCECRIADATADYEESL